MKDKLRIAIIVLFVAYFAVLMKLLVFRQGAAGLGGGGNFVPFKTILDYLNDTPSPGVALFNLAGNIIIFVPLGFLIPALHRSAKWKTVLAAAFAVSLAFETIQGVFKVGVFDVDDILLNVLGALLGYFVWVGILMIVGKIDRSRR